MSGNYLRVFLAAHVLLSGPRIDCGEIVGRFNRNSPIKAHTGALLVGCISEYQLALVHIGLGETEPAMEALQQAYREHSTLLSYLKMDPRFDPLRGNPQFQDLLRRMNFPQ